MTKEIYRGGGVVVSVSGKCFLSLWYVLCECIVI